MSHETRHCHTAPTHNNHKSANNPNKNHMDNKQQQGQQLQIDIKPEVAQGVYSNFAIISHSHAEFIVDLASNLPGTPKAQVVSRVILAPEHAKRLALALQDNIMRYEQEFGKIQLDIQKAAPVPPRTANPFGNGGEA